MNGYIKVERGVAQPGSVLAWGARGRRFKSCRPDHFVSVPPVGAHEQLLIFLPNSQSYLIE